MAANNLRQLLDEVAEQLAQGKERVAISLGLIEAEGLSHMLDDDASQQIDYAPTWAEPIAEPLFIPRGRNELDAMFDAIDEADFDYSFGYDEV